MARLVHRATDGLAADALRTMTAGFRAKKTVRAIARDLAEIGVEVPERTIARRSAEWRADQSRRESAREQVHNLVAAMRDQNMNAAEMLQALAVDALLQDPEAWSGQDPLRVQGQNLKAEEIRLKREEIELRRRAHELNARKFEALQEREERAAAVLEKPEADMTPEQRLREIQEIYGIKPKGANA